MADVVVTTREDRIAAVSALGMTMTDEWLDTGEIRRGPWGHADTLTQEECAANDVALAIAAARAAERDAHARDLALLAEVRGHCELREVLATAEQTRRYLAGLAEQRGRENLEDQAAAWALIVRLLRGEG